MSTLPSPVAALDNETAAMQELLALLQREQECLAAGDADGCAALLDNKATRVAELSACARERHRQLGELGFAATEQGMQQWLTSAAASADALRAWAGLMAIARDAHELNRVNGLLLGQLAGRNRQALAALGIGGDGQGLYGPGGQADYRPPVTARVVG